MDECRQYIQDLDWEVEHLVIYDSHAKVLMVASAKDRESTLLFLVDEASGRVYIRLQDSWYILQEPERRAVIARFIAAQHQDTPIYSVQADTITLPQ